MENLKNYVEVGGRRKISHVVENLLKRGANDVAETSRDRLQQRLRNFLVDFLVDRMQRHLATFKLLTDSPVFARTALADRARFDL